MRQNKNSGTIATMSLTIRLSKMGKRGEGRYRIVVEEKRSRRDGKPVETLGWYEKRETEKRNKIDEKRYAYWVSKGAQPSPTVLSIVKK